VAKLYSYGYRPGRRHRYGDVMADVAYIGPGRRERRPRPLLRTLIGAALRRARLEQGRTLAEVARAARVSMPYLSELERGRKEASSEVLAAICDALRIELGDVLTEVSHVLVPTRRPTGSILAWTARPGAPGRRRPGDVFTLAA
jgi:transcriptional regulator with XRE-family HTH domain